MFASAKGVGFVIGAVAGVVADVEAANTDAILPAARGIADLIIAEDAIAAQVLNAELTLGGTLAADVDLFFAQHGSISGFPPLAA